MALFEGFLALGASAGALGDAFDGKRPENAKGSFLFLLVPSGTIRVREIVEAYIFQHAARHLGEIEHARALVGLGGIS